MKKITLFNIKLIIDLTNWSLSEKPGIESNLSIWLKDCLKKYISSQQNVRFLVTSFFITNVADGNSKIDHYILKELLVHNNHHRDSFIALLKDHWAPKTPNKNDTSSTKKDISQNTIFDHILTLINSIESKINKELSVISYDRIISEVFSNVENEYTDNKLVLVPSEIKSMNPNKVPKDLLNPKKQDVIFIFNNTEKQIKSLIETNEINSKSTKSSSTDSDNDSTTSEYKKVTSKKNTDLNSETNTTDVTLNESLRNDINSEIDKTENLITQSSVNNNNKQ